LIDPTGISPTEYVLVVVSMQGGCTMGTSFDIYSMDKEILKEENDTVNVKCEWCHEVERNIDGSRRTQNEVGKEQHLKLDEIRNDIHIEWLEVLHNISVFDLDSVYVEIARIEAPTRHPHLVREQAFV
jgi:hypothetical protein